MTGTNAKVISPYPVRCQSDANLTKRDLQLFDIQRGRVAEWFKAPVLKAGRGREALS
jgi:hypothetical protein